MNMTNKQDAINPVFEELNELSRDLWQEPRMSSFAKKVDKIVAALATPSESQPVPVGEAGAMPGTSGFTMACFNASDVPIGTKLYTAPQNARNDAIEEVAKALDARNVRMVNIAWVVEFIRDMKDPIKLEE